MHDTAVSNNSPELTSENTDTLNKDPRCAEHTASTEHADALRQRLASLETDLADQSEKISAYRGLLSLALNVYLLFLLLGPVLDALHDRHLPQLRPYQYVSIIEPPFLWCLSVLLLAPSKTRTHR